MRSKIITTVVGTLLLGPFMILGFHDAVSIKQHLTEQTQHIQTLTAESTKLDTALTQTEQTKVASQKEVEQLEQQAKAAQAESARLEAELRAN